MVLGFDIFAGDPHTLGFVDGWFVGLGCGAIAWILWSARPWGGGFWGFSDE